jgi:hypothetical protein
VGIDKNLQSSLGIFDPSLTAADAREHDLLDTVYRDIVT